MEDQKNSSKIEVFLFSFTRFFAVVGSIVGLIAIVVVVLNLLSGEEGSHVAFSDINTEFSET